MIECKKHGLVEEANIGCFKFIEKKKGVDIVEIKQCSKCYTKKVLRKNKVIRLITKFREKYPELNKKIVFNNKAKICRIFDKNLTDNFSLPVSRKKFLSFYNKR